MARLTSMERDQLRRVVAAAVTARDETGVAAIQIRLHSMASGLSGVLAADRRDIARALRELGWRRDGFTGIGYEREPRYVRPEPVGGAAAGEARP